MDPDPYQEAQKHVDPTDPDPQHFPRRWLMNDARRKTARIDRYTQKWRT
jgi:hypothetical protein